MNHDADESRFFWALWVILYPTQPGGLYCGRWLLCGLSSYELPPSTLWATDDGGLHWCPRRSQCGVGDAFRAFSRCHGDLCWVMEPVASLFQISFATPRPKSPIRKAPKIEKHQTLRHREVWASVPCWVLRLKASIQQLHWMLHAWLCWVPRAP